MIRQFINGGMYGDHLPSGAWVVLVPFQHCRTHFGIVPFPPGEAFGPLFVRCTDVGGFRFAGQAHDTDNPAAWERVGLAWVPIAPPCVGVSPLIYDHDGNLHCSAGGPVGSQGFRYVTPDNVLVTGDQTYGPFHGLFEYTDLGDGLWIGQGAENEDGIRVWDGTCLRQLELGDCRHLRANRTDDSVALAFSRLREGVVLVATTMAELRALPPVIDRQPGPVVSVPAVPSLPVKESPVSLPSLDTWLHAELPQLRAAFEKTHPNTNPPDDWYAFQTYRRFVEPDAWPFDRMLRHEQGNDAPVNPQ